MLGLYLLHPASRARKITIIANNGGTLIARNNPTPTIRQMANNPPKNCPHESGLDGGGQVFQTNRALGVRSFFISECCE